MKSPYREHLLVRTRNMSGAKTQRLILAVFASLAVVLGTVIAAVPARATETAENFIQESFIPALEILNSTIVSDEERSAQFRDYMLSLTDIRRIALFTLGQHANRASPIEIDAFVEAYAEFVIMFYEVQLSKYKGHTLTVLGSVDRSADDSVVSVDVSDPTNPNAPIIKAALRVRSNANGDPIIIDAQVEGIWLAITRRADFSSYLQQSGRSVPNLTTFLGEQAKEMRVSGGGTN